MGASAPFALKAGVWFRRGRLFIVSPDSLAQRARCQAETPLIVLFRFLRPALYIIQQKRLPDAHQTTLYGAAIRLRPRLLQPRVRAPVTRQQSSTYRSIQIAGIW